MSILRTLSVTLVLAAPAAAQEVTLRFQHFVNPNSANPKYFMQPWAEAIEEQSNGRIKVELYPFMQLGGSPVNQYDLIADGAIDGGWVIPGYQPGRFPELEALELPFMTPKSAAVSSVGAWEFTEKHLLDDFEDVHVIAAHLHGRGIIHKTGDPIETLADFEGLNLRGPSRPATLLLEKLGANPVGMPLPAFPESLAKGVIEGGVVPWEQVPPLKLDELTGTHTDVAGDNSLYNLYFLWAINKDVYEGLPDDLKAVIDANSGAMAAEWIGRAHDRGDDEAEAQVGETTDNPITTLSAEVTAEIEALGAEVTEAWIVEMTERGFDGAGLVADVRAAMARE
ncbi:TRAP transporter substrate-binding protein [Jannaschia marina]|uniref:TRAP transporter substrate-binding protein n=1 Tax=Jannaschia marina TaxID=2741674 RepID=UPI0015CC3FF8|nr:TRAP transporter substrate-binding protein [Jannaschia marina]